jgi:hypothetical protein
VKRDVGRGGGEKKMEGVRLCVLCERDEKNLFAKNRSKEQICSFQPADSGNVFPSDSGTPKDLL